MVVRVGRRAPRDHAREQLDRDARAAGLDGENGEVIKAAEMVGLDGEHLLIERLRGRELPRAMVLAGGRIERRHIGRRWLRPWPLSGGHCTPLSSPLPA